MDRIVQFGMSPNRLGASGMSALTLFQDSPGFHQPAPEEAAEFGGDPAAEGGSPGAILAGVVLGLAAVWFLAKNMPDRTANLFSPIGFVFVMLTVAATLGVGKLIFSRWPVPGFTPLFASL